MPASLSKLTTKFIYEYLESKLTITPEDQTKKMAENMKFYI